MADINIKLETPVSIREQIFNKLHEAVITGLIKPGERLVESRLAEQLKVSRTPVREALHALEREGLLESIPRVGYRVHEISEREFAEVLELRTLLMNYAVEKVIMVNDRKALDRIGANVAAMQKALNELDYNSFMSLDAEYDDLLMAATRMDKMPELWRPLKRRMILYRYTGIELAKTGIKTLKYHRDIYQALVKGNLSLARDTMHAHLETIKSEVEGKMTDK